MIAFPTGSGCYSKRPTVIGGATLEGQLSSTSLPRLSYSLVTERMSMLDNLLQSTGEGSSHDGIKGLLKPWYMTTTSSGRRLET